MPHGVPNTGTASFPNQARLDSGDFDVIAQGLAGDGVISGCAVTAQGSPNMTVAVAAGYVRLNGQGVAVAAGNVTVTANSSGQSRIDLVVVNGSGVKSVLAGTAQPLPLWPSASGYVVLARIEVPSAVSAITSSHITDKRAVLPSSLVVTPEAFGATADVKSVSATITVTAGQNALTVPGAGFTAADVGKRIVVTQAGTPSATGSVSSVTVSAPGTGYTSIPTAAVVGSGSGAVVQPLMAVQSATIASGGSGYLSGGSGSLTVTISGGFGTAATLNVTVTSGVITAVTSVASGGGYSVLPSLSAAPIVFSVSGTGATFDLAMGVGSFTVNRAGSGYALSGTTVTLTGGGGSGTTVTPVVLPRLAAHVTTIAGRTSSTQITVTDNFGAGGSRYRAVTWGTDDTTAITAALAAVAAGGTVQFADGRNYGITSRIVLPEGVNTHLKGGGVGSTTIFALAAMGEMIYKAGSLGWAKVSDLSLAGSTLPTYNINLEGSNGTRLRDMVVTDAAQGGANLKIGKSDYSTTALSCDVTGVRFSNQTGYDTAYDLPRFCIEIYGTDNKFDVFCANAYDACLYNESGNNRLTNFHGFGFPLNLAPQYIVWDKGNIVSTNSAFDTWAPGGAGLYRDDQFTAVASIYTNTAFVYTTAVPPAGSNAIRLVSGAKAIITGSTPPGGQGTMRTVDLVSQLGTANASTILVNNFGFPGYTGPALPTGTIADPSVAGSFALNVHNGTAGGGNALGGGAVDLALVRETADNVASGAGSFQAGMRVKSAGLGSSVLGVDSTATGNYSHVRGRHAGDRGMVGKDVWSSGRITATGDCQAARQILSASTTSTTATRLTVSNAGVGFNTVGQLNPNSAWLMRGRLIARKTDGTAVAWRLSEIMISKGATIASTALDGTPTWTLLTSNTLSVATPTLTADNTTYGAPVFMVTAPDTGTWRWMLVLDTDEIA